jgi:UDP-perosamine 4-acetyltransferase
MKVLLIGSGGHARVCAEILTSLGWDIAGCLNHDGDQRTEVDAPVLGPDSELEARVSGGSLDVFVAIGDNRARAALGQRVLAVGGRLVSAVSPYAVVSPSARIGRGVVVMAGAVVNAGTTLGDLVIVNTNATVDHDCSIAEGAHVAPGAILAGGVNVGSLTLVGVGAAVAPQVTIGSSTIVGAGAAVVGNLPDSVTAVGVPARPVGRVQG